MQPKMSSRIMRNITQQRTISPTKLTLATSLDWRFSQTRQNQIMQTVGYSSLHSEGKWSPWTREKEILRTSYVERSKLLSQVPHNIKILMTLFILPTFTKICLAANVEGTRVVSRWLPISSGDNDESLVVVVAVVAKQVIHQPCS